MFWSRLKAVFGLASPGEHHAPQALEWQQALAAVPILQGFSQDEEQQLIELARHFLPRKTLTQLGVELSPRQQGVLALQAVLLFEKARVSRDNLCFTAGDLVVTRI